MQRNGVLIKETNLSGGSPSKESNNESLNLSPERDEIVNIIP
jgi:hypothetical protein